MQRLSAPGQAKQLGSLVRTAHSRPRPRARLRAAATARLSPQQLKEFNSAGFLVLPDFASPVEVERLQARIRELVAAFDPASSQSIFSTRDQQRKTDRQFLDSASTIDFFWEEDAIQDGRLVKPKEQAINKIGHAQHDIDPVCREWSRSAKVAELLADLGYRRPAPVQSMIIFKQPFVGGEVVPHQDSSFLYTDPPTCTGLWLALEDASRDNGCLWALPRSHEAGIYRLFVRGADDSVAFDEGRGWVGAAAPGAGDMPAFDEAAFVPVEVKAGTAVLLHGANVHSSKANTSPASRHAYTLHFVETAPDVAWSPQNWLQRPAHLPFEPLYDDASAAPARA